MSKRTHDETNEERWTRKMKKYESKIYRKRQKSSQRIIYSSDEEDVQPQEHLESNIAMSVDHENSIECDETLPPQAVDENYDSDLINILCEIDTETVTYDEDLHENIAKCYQQILCNGLTKEIRDELTKKYQFPKNVPFAKGPTLNPEISAMLVDNCKLRDKRLLSKQDQIGRAISALGKAMTMLLKRNPDVPEVIKTLNDSGKLMADSHYAETDTRRSVIIPLVDKSLVDPFKDRKRDNLLFGSDLGDLVKSSRSIKKTSQLILATPTSNNNLNYKGPPSRTRPQRGGGVAYPHRPGGPQATNPRRRRPPAPPPPPRRHVPPPPPPPAWRQTAARTQRIAPTKQTRST